MFINILIAVAGERDKSSINHFCYDFAVFSLEAGRFDSLVLRNDPNDVLTPFKFSHKMTKGRQLLLGLELSFCLLK